MGYTLSSLEKPTEERAFRVPDAWAEDTQNGARDDSNQPKRCYPKRATVFPEFRKLPPEVRLKIWKYALPGPLNIDIGFDIHFAGVWDKNGNAIIDLTDDTDELDPTKYWTEFITKQPSPALLHVCQESRHVALKKYNTYLDSKENEGCKRIPINFDEDTIVLMGFSRFNVDDQILTSSGLKNVKRLAIDVPTWRRFRSVYWEDFQNLEQVTIILPCYRQDLRPTDWDRYGAMAGINFVGEPRNNRAQEHITQVAHEEKSRVADTGD